MTDENGYFSYGPYVFNDTLDVMMQAGENISSNSPNFTDTNIVLTPSPERPGIIRDQIITPYNQQIPLVEAYRERTPEECDFELQV